MSLALQWFFMFTPSSMQKVEMLKIHYHSDVGYVDPHDIIANANQISW
jgi:hypothetical protein